MRSWTLIWPEEVRKWLKEILPPRKRVRLPLADLHGKTLAHGVSAEKTHPSFRQSSVDGYALGSVQDAPYVLVGESRAGAPFSGSLGEAEAIRIFTGAAVPDSACAIVMQEHTQASEHQIFLTKPPLEGAFIREKGEQYETGSPIFPEGHTITPENFGLLHGLGVASAEVFETPKIHLLITGHEVMPFPQPLAEGQIWDENGPALQAFCAQHHLPFHLSYVGDELEEMTQKIKEGCKANLIIVTGGVSVGDYDLVPEALEKAGVEKCFHGVRQKPGKPLWVGKKDQTLVFALPGNPAAVMCIWHLYLLPLINYLKGKPLCFPEDQAHFFSLGAEMAGEMGRVTYARATLMNQEIFPASLQASYMLGGFSHANGLAVIPAGKNKWSKGERVAFIPF